MAQRKRNQHKKKTGIQAIIPTNEKLTGRAGLSFYAGNLRGIELFPHIERLFGSLRKNRKGIEINELFVQILSFFMDGSSRHVRWFDQLKADDSYATLLGPDRLASSHAMERFFGSFEFWRLKESNPSVIVGAGYDRP
ncbi:MAG: hypothetical protein HGB15_09075 [Chlorobaculum sp.]|nr:hypothetical protein [Chlorobaculum sp.]